MFKHADFQNFRCLRDVHIDFAPLTAFVGPNASGKSAILSGLEPSKPPQPLDAWQRRTDVEVKVEIIYADASRRTQSWEPTRGRTGAGNSETYQILRLDLSQLRQPNQVVAQSQLAANGANLSNVIATLSRSQQAELAAELCRLVPVFADVNVRPYLRVGFQHILFQDKWASDVWYSASEVSDGTMLLLAFLTLQYQEPPIQIVAIEEPERGLHPYLLGELIGFLRKLSKGAIGKKAVQVILATHSAELLEFLRPEEVRFMTRDPEDGSVRVEMAPTQSPAWEKAFEQYEESLGSAWLSGGLGGVPTR